MLRIFQKTRDGAVRIITTSKEQYLFGHVPFSALVSTTKVKKTPRLKKVESAVTQSTYTDSEGEFIPMFGSPIRIKTAITRDQLERRECRNTTRKTISKGVLKKETVTYVDYKGFTVPYERETLVGARSKYVCHDSHGRHGRKPVYKDQQSLKLGRFIADLQDIAS